MKKFNLSIALFFLLLIIFVPFLVKADGIVPCQTNCGISDLFTMLERIYSFIVLQIATPLAVIAVSVGGILMLISAGNPKWLQTGKDVLKAGIIGLVLVFCSWLIIDFILKAIGGSGL